MRTQPTGENRNVPPLANADNVNDFLDCGGPDAALDPYLWSAGPKPRSWKISARAFFADARCRATEALEFSTVVFVNCNFFRMGQLCDHKHRL
jgi:hypothetical protein